MTDTDTDAAATAEPPSFWWWTVDRLLRYQARPVDLKIVLALSALVGAEGELENGEHVMREATGLHPYTIHSSVRWLVAAGILVRHDGCGGRRHRLAFAIDKPRPTEAPPSRRYWDDGR